MSPAAAVTHARHTLSAALAEALRSRARRHATECATLVCSARLAPAKLSGRRGSSTEAICALATCTTAALPMLRAFRRLTLSLLRAGRALALRLVSGRLRLQAASGLLALRLVSRRL